MANVSISRLNQLVNCAMMGADPGPLTPDEAEAFERIRAQVEANPDVAYRGVFEG